MKQVQTYNVDVFRDPDINNYWKDELWVPKVIVVEVKPKNETEIWNVAEFADDSPDRITCIGRGETTDGAYKNLIAECEAAGILVSSKLYDLIRDSQYVGRSSRMHKWELMRIISTYHDAILTLTNASYKNDVILRYELSCGCLCGCCHETAGYIKDGDKETKLFSGESIEEIVTELAAVP